MPDSIPPTVAELQARISDLEAQLHEKDADKSKLMAEIAALRDKKEEAEQLLIEEDYFDTF